MNAQVTSDTSYQFSLNNSGEAFWGPGNTAQDTFLSRSGAGELGLSGTSDASLTVTSDSNGLIVAGKTNLNYQLLLGLNSNYGSIQGIEQGTGYTPLVLNPSGGYVSVNTALPPSYPLDVDGAIRSSLGYHMPTSGGVGAILNYNDENTAFSSTVAWSTYTSALVSCTFSQTSNKVIFTINTITLTPST